mmetsp:Transcript_63136/g.102110  ORF Transcript_63136/g.102110 Transcript_63136/m.102110 type:complete len:155 (+) Transcript_63136:2-466(+)
MNVCVMSSTMGRTSSACRCIARAGVETLRAGHVLRRLSIGKNEWPREWIARQDRWIDMDSDTQRLWRVLGWSEQLWTAGRLPPIQRKAWEALRESERTAAEKLGYCGKLWMFEDKTSARGAGKKKRRNIYPAFDGPGDWESSYVTGTPTPVDTE